MLMNENIAEIPGLYEVLTDELHHDGDVLRRGAFVKLMPRQAAPLLVIDAISPVSDDGDGESVAGAADGAKGKR